MQIKHKSFRKSGKSQMECDQKILLRLQIYETKLSEGGGWKGADLKYEINGVC